MINDRLPPFNEAAEKAAVGCLLSGGKHLLDLAAEKLSEEQFYDLRWRGLFTTIMELHARGDAVDMITVYSEDPSALPVAELNAVADAPPSPDNLAYYIEELQSCHTRRKLIEAATRIEQQCREGDPEEGVAEVAENLLKELNVTNVNELPWKSVLDKAIERIELANSGVKPGLQTGFKGLDRLTGGLHKKEMMIVAARPSVGKTAIALNIATNLLKAKIPGGIFSLEMPSELLAQRQASAEGSVDSQKIREGNINQGELQKLALTFGKMSKWPIRVDDRPGLSINQVRGKARQWKHESAIEWLMVDYLQLMHGTSSRQHNNREREVSEISSGLKSIAKELDVAVLALSQLNRDSDKNERKPRLSDLRESGSIEQDADIVGFLWRPAAESPEEVDLVIGKQRNGPIGDVPLVYRKEFTRFEERPPVDMGDVPNLDTVQRIGDRQSRRPQTVDSSFGRGV